MTEKKSSKIDETLKKLVSDMSKASSQTSSSTEDFAPTHSLPGDPQCPYCHGLGYLRQDLPLGHPEFGRLQICSCRQAQINQRVRQRLFKLSQLDELSHHTFENFEERGRVGLSPKQASSLEQAYNHAQRFAQSLNGWLLLQGGFGCGKTHLAAAIANFAVSMGVPTLFITVPDLLDTLRFAYQDPEATFEQRFNEIRQAPLLILDDFGTQNATAWAQEKLFQILNYRYINQLPLVVTTNLLEQDIDERISSRLHDPELVTRVRILAPDYRNPTGDTGHHKLSSLDLLHDRSFENFELRQRENLPASDVQSLEKAFNAARQFAERPAGWLVIMGTYGSGKTHLAAAIANFRVDNEAPPLFIVVPDLLDHLRATFSPSSTVTLDRRFEEIRTSPLLILDDLGTQATTPWVKEKLYQLFNYRYNAELPTVITTAISLEDMDPRLRSRMMDRRLCRIYAITAPPYTGLPVENSKPGKKRARAK
ncbi:MAG: ATP-binding protein [Anaerolineales bacterium]|nr:ATP-binding protein [Anaerolineales bacterium]